jgi:hypothetical protein
MNVSVRELRHSPPTQYCNVLGSTVVIMSILLAFLVKGTDGAVLVQMQRKMMYDGFHRGGLETFRAEQDRLSVAEAGGLLQVHG